MKENIKKYFEEFKLGTKKMFKEFFNKDTNKKQRANMWTFSRLISPIFVLIFSIAGLITQIYPLLMIAGLIAGGGALTDFFDGRSSRKYNSTSEYGKLLDQVSDKVFAGIIGINLLFINPYYIITLLGELSISLINISFQLKNKELNIKSSRIGKIKEWPLFFTLSFGYFSGINNILNTIGITSVFITLFLQGATAIDYYQNNSEKVKNSKKLNIIRECMENVSEKDIIKTPKNIKHYDLEKVESVIDENKKSKESNSTSRIEEYTRLRDVLQKIIAENQNELSNLSNKQLKELCKDKRND